MEIKMREIKFRAWDKENKMWLRDDSTHITLNGYIFSCQDGNCITNTYRQVNDKVVLVEFTGLKDKNGKEIYEGFVYDHSDGLVVVEWNIKACCFEAVFIAERDSNIPVWEIEFLGCNYVGNIHANPELLKA